MVYNSIRMIYDDNINNSNENNNKTLFFIFYFLFTFFYFFGFILSFWKFIARIYVYICWLNQYWRNPIEDVMILLQMQADLF